MRQGRRKRCNDGVYLVDRDLQGITGAGLVTIQRAEISASRQLTAAGQRVRYLRSMFIPGEARCMCLFEAEDEATVVAVNLAARLPFTRIVAAAVHPDRRGAGPHPVTAVARALVQPSQELRETASCEGCAEI